MERSEIHALFRRLSSGVYVIGVADGDRRNAFTAAWVMQVSYEPLLLALSINPNHASYPILQGSGVFAVSVLGRGSTELVRRFGTASGRDDDKLAGVAWHPVPSGAPVLDEALAYFDCVLTATLPAGDHAIVVGRVAGGRILDRTADPMLYAETGDVDGSSALYPATF